MKRSAVFGGLTMAMILPASAALASNSNSSSDSQVYVVRQGDTFDGLSSRYLLGPTASAEVQRINRVANPRLLPVGTRLNIPRRLLRSEPIELRLQAFSGPVTVTSSGRRIDPRAGLVLQEGTSIETGANGFVSVSAADGSRIALPSNSLARFGRSRRYLIDRAADIDVEVARGRSEVRAAPQNPGGSFRVRTPVAVTAVRGTEFRVGLANAGDVGFTEVVEGHVGVNSSQTETGVEHGFGAAVRADGNIATEALLAMPGLEHPGRVQTDEAVNFAIRPIAGARGYHLQLARDAGFVEVLAETTNSDASASFADVPNGMYFVRAGAIAASGLEGLADSWSFRRQRVGLAASAEAGPEGAFRFAWSAQGEGSSTYRFQLFKENTDAALVDEAGLAANAISLTGLKPGAYHWRVGVIQTGPDGSAEVWMPLQRVNISG